MKKKIKDLTLEECELICKKRDCCEDRCPLITCYLGLKKHPEYLEMEVEIDD